MEHYIVRNSSRFASIINSYISGAIKYMYNEYEGVFEFKVFDADIITYSFYEMAKLFQYRTTNLKKCKVCNTIFMGTRITSCVCDNCRKSKYEKYKKRMQRAKVKLSNHNKSDI